jgi:bacteriorhodopsin
VVVLQVLHAISLFVFSKVEFPFAWVWYGFGLIFWLSIGILTTIPIWNSAKKQSSRVYIMCMLSLIGLLTAQLLYPTNLALLKTSKISLTKFFIALGILDFITRIGLGVYFCLNGDAFGEIEIQVTKSLKTD